MLPIGSYVNISGISGKGKYLLQTIHRQWHGPPFCTIAGYFQNDAILHFDISQIHVMYSCVRLLLLNLWWDEFEQNPKSMIWILCKNTKSYTTYITFKRVLFLKHYDVSEQSLNSIQFYYVLCQSNEPSIIIVPFLGRGTKFRVQDFPCNGPKDSYSTRCQ